jgi:hypothetical protein
MEPNEAPAEPVADPLTEAPEERPAEPIKRSLEAVAPYHPEKLVTLTAGEVMAAVGAVKTTHGRPPKALQVVADLGKGSRDLAPATVVRLRSEDARTLAQLAGA